MSERPVRAEPRFDEAIHAPTRLRVCAMLRPLDEADFATIARTLELSEANLSKTIRNLAELGYISTTKRASPDRADARQTTTVRLTSRGRAAFDGHVAALRALTD